MFSNYEYIHNNHIQVKRKKRFLFYFLLNFRYYTKIMFIIPSSNILFKYAL